MGVRVLINRKVKMAGYWPSSLIYFIIRLIYLFILFHIFFFFYGPCINTQEKNDHNIQPFWPNKSKGFIVWPVKIFHSGQNDNCRAGRIHSDTSYQIGTQDSTPNLARSCNQPYKNAELGMLCFRMNCVRSLWAIETTVGTWRDFSDSSGEQVLYLHDQTPQLSSNLSLAVYWR